MKKLSLVIVFFAYIFVFDANPANAASDLEVWCLAEGQTWNPSTSTCTVTGYPNVFLSETLLVLAGETIAINEGGDLDVYGTITNSGTIYSHGILDIYFGVIDNGGEIENDGAIFNTSGIINNNGGTMHNANVIYNHGTIENNGEIYNYSSGSLFNYGPVNNGRKIYNFGEIINYGSGVIDNSGDIFNYGTIDNSFGVINNNGAVYNVCYGIYIGEPPVGTPIIDFTCVYLPFVYGDQLAFSAVNQYGFHRGLIWQWNNCKGRILSCPQDDNFWGRPKGSRPTV